MFYPIKKNIKQTIFKILNGISHIGVLEKIYRHKGIITFVFLNMLLNIYSKIALYIQNIGVFRCCMDTNIFFIGEIGREMDIER